MLPSPMLLDPGTAAWLLHDGNGNIRAALICWGIVLSAFVMLRIPRQVLLGCLIVAGATIGLAATVLDMTSGWASASPSASEIAVTRPQAASPLRGPAANPPERKRPY